MGKVCLKDFEDYLKRQSFSEFIVSSSNIDDESMSCSGIKYSIKFNSVSVALSPAAILLGGASGHMSLTGISSVEIEEHVLGIIAKLILSSGISVSIICR